MKTMTKQNSDAQLTFNEQNGCYQCKGSWSINNLDSLRLELKDLAIPQTQQLSISGKHLSYFDSAGALALQSFASTLREKNKNIEFVDFTEQQSALIKLIKNKKDMIVYQVPPTPKKEVMYRLGEETVHKIHQVNGFIQLLGDLSTKLLEAFRHWRQFRLPSILSNVDSTGLKALPIVALLSFLIGVVLAYQMGLQLKTYGANSFIAYLSGMAIFREFAPLITAIIVAGRTSSAFTAQLGSMKINEEIDALNTMGLSTTELLVVPKVLGLVLVFPLLIFWADFFSIVGSMIMSKSMLNIGYFDFLTRLKDSVGLKQMMLGLYKAPAFALIISLVGCFQGFAVESNAASIGSQTTKSVVQALFLIIIADAIFSVAYSWMKL